jgi:DnaJ-class molecular chaperone
MRAKDIGRVLGLQRSTVNAYLYSQKPNALGKDVYQDSNYGWHLKSAIASGTRRERPAYQPRKQSTAQASRPYVESQSSLDRYISVQISLEDAFKGARKTIQDGNTTVALDIPPRTRPGTQICVRGKGATDHSVNRRGNLYCWVNLSPDSPFALSGNDVILRTSIDSSLAAEGGKLQVLTLDGSVKVSVPSGVKTGTKLRLKQKGWTTSAGGRGDQYIHLEVRASRPHVVTTPTPVSTDSKSETNYPPEVIQEVFRDPDYALLSDNEQGKLAEMLEKAELARQRQDLAKTQKLHPLAVLTSGWFWFAVPMGGMLTYGGLRLAPQFMPTPPTPIEQQPP